MSKIRNNSFLKVLLLSLVIIFVNLLITDEDSIYTNIEIEHGDTLWNLAERYKGEMSRSEWIHIVKTQNDLENDTIVAGKELMIPISSENMNGEKSIKIASNE